MKEQFPQLPNWFVRYILVWFSHHRREILMADGEADLLEVLRGVPQGSILAPFCFNVFINDLIQNLEAVKGIDLEWPGSSEPLEINCLGYADDIGQVGELKKVGGKWVCVALRDAVKVCVEWQRKNGMKFAAAKCKLLRLGSRTKDPSGIEALKMDGVVLERVDSFKYLGVVFRDTVRQSQLDSSKAKEKVEKFCARNFTGLEAYYGIPLEVASRMVRTLFLPKMLFGAEIFDPQLKLCNLAMGAMARKMLCCYDTDPTALIFRYLGWQPVERVVMQRVVRFALRIATCRF